MQNCDGVSRSATAHCKRSRIIGTIERGKGAGADEPAQREWSVTQRDKIGILTGGGDVPGLNSVIKSVVYGASEFGRKVIGFRKGWEGLPT